MLAARKRTASTWKMMCKLVKFPVWTPFLPLSLRDYGLCPDQSLWFFRVREEPQLWAFPCRMGRLSVVLHNAYHVACISQNSPHGEIRRSAKFSGVANSLWPLASSISLRTDTPRSNNLNNLILMKLQASTEIELVLLAFPTEDRV